MKKLMIIMMVVSGLIVTGCHKQSISNNKTVISESLKTNVTPDSGMNIVIGSLAVLLDDNKNIGADSVAEDINWADIYMHDFLDWEERVGMQEMLGGKLYPEWYGGFYIEDGKMVFLLTSESGVETLPEGAIWKKCKYSHNELKAIEDKVSKGVYDNLERFKAAGMSVKDKLNRVVVYLGELSDEDLQFFKDNIYDGEEVIINYVNSDEEIVTLQL